MASGFSRWPHNFVFAGLIWFVNVQLLQLGNGLYCALLYGNLQLLIKKKLSTNPVISFTDFLFNNNLKCLDKLDTVTRISCSNLIHCYYIGYNNLPGSPSSSFSFSLGKAGLSASGNCNLTYKNKIYPRIKEIEKNRK